MKAIYKYPLPITDWFTLQLPRDHTIIKLEVQNEIPTLWCIIEVGIKDFVDVDFRIAGTGQKLTADCTKESYVDSFILNNSFVGHLFKIKY